MQTICYYLSPSVTYLQRIIRIAQDELASLDMSINAKKDAKAIKIKMEKLCHKEAVMARMIPEISRI